MSNEARLHLWGQTRDKKKRKNTDEREDTAFEGQPPHATVSFGSLLGAEINYVNVAQQQQDFVSFPPTQHHQCCRRTTCDCVPIIGCDLMQGMGCWGLPLQTSFGKIQGSNSPNADKEVGLICGLSCGLEILQSNSPKAVQ